MFRRATVKSVDSILASFQKTIDDLNEVANLQTEAANEANREIDAQLVKRNAAEFEAKRAASAADKIQMLLG